MKGKIKNWTSELVKLVQYGNASFAIFGCQETRIVERAKNFTPMVMSFGY